MSTMLLVLLKKLLKSSPRMTKTMCKKQKAYKRLIKYKEAINTGQVLNICIAKIVLSSGCLEGW